MADILSIADFEEGKNKITYNTYSQGDLQSYIDTYEKHYLIKLLGVKLYNDFINDLSGGVPQTARFLSIYNSIAEEIDHFNVTTRGMKTMLMGFVYFHYVRDNMTKQTNTGSKSVKGDNTTNVSATSALIQSRFNDSVDDARNIQFYIEENDSDYTKYNGVKIGYSLHI